MFSWQSACLPALLLQVSLEGLGRALHRARQSAVERRRQGGVATSHVAAELAATGGWDALASGLWSHVQALLTQQQAAWDGATSRLALPPSERSRAA